MIYDTGITESKYEKNEFVFIRNTSIISISLVVLTL